MIPPEIDPQLQKLLDRDAEVRAQFDNPHVTEVDLRNARPGDVGLVPCVVDELGRFWRVVPSDKTGNRLILIFDPNWLHSSKRWHGARMEGRLKE